MSGEGLTFSARVTPRAGKDKIKSVTRDDEGRLLIMVSITAPPVEGEANAHLVKFLAKTLGIKKHDVVIIRGETGRTKILSISGLGEADMVQKLREAVDS